MEASQRGTLTSCVTTVQNSDKMPSCGKGASMNSDSENKFDGQYRSTGTPQDPLANCLIRFVIVLTQWSIVSAARNGTKRGMED